MVVTSIFRCIVGPKLLRVYRSGEREGKLYDPNILESYSDSVVRYLSVAWSLGVYTSPVIASILYRKGYFSIEGVYSLTRLASVISLLLIGTLCLRGIGRYASSDYLTFLAVVDAAKKNTTKENKIALSQYDFEFSDWPVEFRWNDSKVDQSKSRIYLERSTKKRNEGVLEKIMSFPCQMLSYVAIHSFGRRMIYPGAVKLLQAAVAPMLMQGRAKLIEEYQGERFKLLTKDNNEIDSVFIDRRRKIDMPHGNTLVVCCEGNAGFYEYGIMSTPLEAGYSVLGWNHPGFGGSTGVPFPSQETAAVDVVMQFAITQLGFSPENIIIYAWSIGGFAATWAAMNYPDVKGLVLDATFDDLLHLALTQMPPSWKPLVVRTIRDYMNLNNSEQICRYPGPVLLIRRTRDEVIATRPSSPQTNRGNDLLIKILQCRYPKLISDDTLYVLKDWLSGDRNHQIVVWTQQGVEEELCHASLTSYIEENSPSFPMFIGEDMPTDMKIQLLLYLASNYMIDFDSTHCTPLPSSLFRLPWDPLTSNGTGTCQLQQDSCP